MINSQYKLEKYSQPYGIWILDHFLDKENYSILRNQWPSHDESGWNKGVGKIFDQDGVLENKMLAMSGKEVIPKIYQNFINFMQSSNTIKIIEKTFFYKLIYIYKRFKFFIYRILKYINFIFF